MKNYQSTRKAFGAVIYFGLALLAVFLNSTAFAQSFCGTTGSAGSIGEIPGNITVPSNAPPIYLRIYVHSVAMDDGSDAPTVEAIKQSINILNADFAARNIFFVWECGIIPINSTALYNVTSDEGFSCGLSQYSSHDDGIDIFIGSDDAPAAAGAIDVPSKAFIIKGTFECTGVSDFVLSKTKVISHEMGHCLGLWHTHHGAEGAPDCNGMEPDPDQCPEKKDGSNSASCGDYITDTPADPRIETCYDTDGNLCTYDIADGFSPNMQQIMSYTHANCMVEFSERQAHRMRQMILVLSPDLQHCIIEADQITTTIVTNTTWTTANTPNNGNFILNEDVTIEFGATLTINPGVIVRFGEQNKLIIKPNGRLILLGTLTSMGCLGVTWQGVKVWGSGPSQSQYPNQFTGSYHQGRIVCRPGSLIENAAETGIELFGPTYELSGGQIQSTGGTIKNCPIGVQFAPYQNFWPYPTGNLSGPTGYAGWFSGSVFLADDDFPKNSRLNTFVEMVSVNSPTFYGCSFVNDRTITSTDFFSWGTGISANDAGFTVTGKLTQYSIIPIPTAFEGLGYGIFTDRIVKGQPYSVTQTNFSKCFYGIRNRSVGGGTIVGNSFELGELPTGGGVSPQVGVLFDTDVPGFTCEENYFTNPSGGSSFETYGTVCTNTGDANKTIRRNTYDGLYAGNLADKVNNNEMAGGVARGVYYECNKNYDAIASDFIVSSAPGVKREQGVAVFNPSNGQVIGYQAAENVFSDSPDPLDFYNDGLSINYRYDQFGANEEPINFAGPFFKFPAQFQNSCPAYCPPPCGGEGELANIKNNFHTTRTAFQALKADYAVNPTGQKARQLDYYQRIMDESAYIIVLHEQNDTLSFNNDTLNTWIANLASLEGDIWLANRLLHAGQATTAKNLLDASVTKYQLGSEEQADLSNYKSLINLLDGKPIYQLDAATLQALEAYLYISYPHTKSWARSIATLYGQHFPPEFEVPTIERGQTDKELPVENGKQGSWLKVQPNPAKDFVNFTVSLPDSNVEATVFVYDLNGKLIFQQEETTRTATFHWDCGRSPSGIYFYKVLTNTAFQQSGKVFLEK